MGAKTQVRTRDLFAGATQGEQAIVVIFDLDGFSRFFAQPDVHTYVAKYLNHVFEAMNTLVDGGDQYWLWGKHKNTMAPLPVPIHKKFMGDGMLYIWKERDFTLDQKKELVNRLWNLKSGFEAIVKRCEDDVPVLDLPKRIRFGVSAGSIHKLKYSGRKGEEYIGYSINLASRLTNYCKELGFIASARIGLDAARLVESRYKKVVAKDIRGITKEIVFVDQGELDLLSPELRSQLFDELDA